MKRSSIITACSCAAVVGVAGFFTGALSAQESWDEMTPEMQKVFEAWMEFSTPGEMHEKMNDVVGQWRTVMKHWASPDAPPETSEGALNAQWMLGDRYLHERHSGSFMGQPFEGHNVWGYDQANDEYFSFWIDNLGTGYMMTKGNWDSSGKKMVMTGEMSDPNSPNGWTDVRAVYTMHSEDKTSYTMYMTKDGREMKVMELISTREG